MGIMNGSIVCHTGIIQFPMQKGKKRVHRLVVLPDYQGIGIGTRFIREIARIVSQRGYELNLTTTTPSLVGALRRDRSWVLARFGRAKQNYDRFSEKYGLNSKHLSNATSEKRITYSFWYKGGG